MNQKQSGILCAFASYLIWGFLAAYWKVFKGVPALEIMAHRMFWAFLIGITVLAVNGRAGEVFSLYKDRARRRLIIFRAGFLVVNWYTYIWAVGNGYLLEASLGYYLNPLISIFLGLIFLRERLSPAQWAAVGFAVAGVLLKTVLVGRFPFIAVVLALTFGIYGLLKKKSSEGALVGVTAETLLVVPFASVFLIYSELTGSGSLVPAPLWMKLMFVTTGLVTIVPLSLFSFGAGRIPLIWIGFLQFIAPTLMMVFGLLMYHESMSLFDLSGFILVWIGIIIFLLSFRKAD